MFAEHPPDLVVSGINPGENIGRVLIGSGTVGAAQTAASEDVPALAVNLELDRRTAPTFAGSLAAYPDAARYVARLVAQLDRTRRRGAPLLDPGQVLNVTYPAVPGADGRHDDRRVRRPLITAVGRRRIARFVVSEEPAGSGRYTTTTVLCGLDSPCEPETRRGADTSAIDNDHVSITPLLSAWTAPLGIRRAVGRRLDLGL